MKKTRLKIKSFEIDHVNKVTNVVWHEWDGVYFCLSCALDPKTGTVDGVVWNSPAEVMEAIKIKYYGYDSK